MELNFQLSYEDGERLFAVKQIQGYDNLSGNDFAEHLLSKELMRLFPAVPEFDDSGNIVNADRYNGRPHIRIKLLEKITAAYNADVQKRYAEGEMDFIPIPHKMGEMLDIILTKYALDNFPEIIGG